MSDSPVLHKVEAVSIAKLIAAGYNPRKISDSQMKALKHSMQEVGFIQNIVINSDYTIISGHQRVDAAKALGMLEINAVVLELTKEKEQALNVAMNKIGGEFEMRSLAELISKISQDDAAVQLTGMENNEVSKLLDSINNPKPEEEAGGSDVEEALKLPLPKPDERRGEIWQLGSHRLMCGDARSIDDLTMLIDGDGEADMVWTEPPSASGYAALNESLGKNLTESQGREMFKEFMAQTMANLNYLSRDGAVFYVCTGWEGFSYIEQAMRDSEIHIDSVIVWAKRKHSEIIKTSGKGRGGKSIFFGWKPGNHHTQPGAEFDIWDEPTKADAYEVHPTEKPDWLVMRALRNSSKVKDLILDPFAGAGSCLMACEKTGRRFRGMEIDPRFIDVIIQRWQNYTGETAVRIDDMESETAITKELNTPEEIEQALEAAE